jgi:hypothetical protein
MRSCALQKSKSKEEESEGSGAEDKGGKKVSSIEWSLWSITYVHILQTTAASILLQIWILGLLHASNACQHGLYLCAHNLQYGCSDDSFSPLDCEGFIQSKCYSMGICSICVEMCAG